MNEAFEQVLGYARGIWRRRWLVLIVAWVIAAVGWVSIYLMENRYEAQARVYVDTQSMLRPLLSGLAVQPNLEQQISMMTRTIASRPNLEKVARMTDLDLRAKTPQLQESLYNSLAAGIKLQGTERENLYTITYAHANPDLAKRIVQSLLTIFTESALGSTRKAISSSQQFIDEQLKTYEAKLLDKEKQLEDFKRRNLGSMPGQGGDYYAKLNEINLALEQARLQLDEAANRKKQLEQQLEDQEEVLITPSPSMITATSSALDGRISALQNQLDSLRLRYTDMHPEVSRVRQLIARLQEQKQQEEESTKKQVTSNSVGIKAQNPVYQQLSIAIAEADANMASLQTRVGQIQKKRGELIGSADRIPRIEAEYTQLMRDYDIFKKNYQDLLSRRETAMLSGEVESKTDAVEFRVIDPPRVPTKPVSPNRPLLVAAVPFGGIGAGLAIAFLLGQLRPTVESRRQLKELTQYPLLGLVTKIDTEKLRRKQRRNNMLFVGGSMAMVVALMAQLVYYLIFSPAA